MDSHDGSLFWFGGEWVCEPACVHVFLCHLAQSGIRESVPLSIHACAPKLQTYVHQIYEHVCDTHTLSLKYFYASEDLHSHDIFCSLTVTLT